MNYDLVNHNSYPDEVTLANCTYVNVKNGCTGTISNTNYAEINENNTDLNITDSSYIEIGKNNRNVTVISSEYVKIGENNKYITVGSNSNSISVSRDCYNITATGGNTLMYKATNCDVDGLYNKIENSGSIKIENCVGTKLEYSKSVNIQNTNNNRISTSQLSLESKKAFMGYTKYKKVTRAESLVTEIDRQSDSVGTILDTQLNSLINTGSDLKSEKQKYTKVNGVWTLVEQ